jgi:transcriptional/translational regulatory protein YebC/TACO1
MVMYRMFLSVRLCRPVISPCTRRFAGHNKWSKIFRLKAAADQKKGQVFSKISKEIMVAIKSKNGVTDVSSNPLLALALEKAKTYQVPKATVDAAIKKALGQDIPGNSHEPILYEGFGPLGLAVLVDVLTDNRNRTATHLRHIFSKHG